MATQAALKVPEDDQDTVSRVRFIAQHRLRPIAGAIDRKGHYPKDVLQELGEAGAFAQHQAAYSASGRIDLSAAIESMAAIAEECGSTAFCTWCQDACGWYLQNTENALLREQLQKDVAFGRVFGGTGLSNPMKSLSGIEPLKLSGRRVAGGYEISGILPWVSNVEEGHRFAIVFRDADSGRLLMALAEAGKDAALRHNARFMALEGTATHAAVFKNAFIADHAMLADDAPAFAKRIRPGFVLLQTGIALGIIRASLISMRELAGRAGGTNAFIPNGPDEVEDRLVKLTDAIHHAASTPFETTADYRKQLLTTRLEAAELSLAAAQSAMLHAGASGYIEGAAANRRLREAYFVAILTPSIKHLRKDLAALRASASR